MGDSNTLRIGSPWRSFTEALQLNTAGAAERVKEWISRSPTKDLALQMAIAEDTERAAISAAQRNEILMKLLSTVLGLAVSFGISYYGIRWLVNVMDPTRNEKKESQKRAEKLMKTIGVQNVKLTDYELCIASNLVDPLTMVTDWQDIGGLQQTVQEIQNTVILPFKHRNIFSRSGLIQPPKGVLLYGPPGCGKTMIAKATAKATGARFINLQVSSLVDKWYGESQKRAEAVFTLAHKLQPTIIFIDEIDSFLRARMSSDHEATSMIKTQFMSFWDGLITDPHCHIMIIGATNRPTDVDAAILRRMPCMFHIGLPDQLQRKNILEIILKDEVLDPSVDLKELAAETEGLSGSDLREVCRSAAITRVLMCVELEESSRDAEKEEEEEEERDRNEFEDRSRITRTDFVESLDKFRKTKRVSVSASFQQISLD